MSEIYTYANPLTMKQDELIWEKVKKYPQFCASDTLVQGMIQHYGRNEFSVIRTVDELQKSLVGDVTNNVQFDMQLYLDVSHVVRKNSENQDLKKSFQSNIGEVVNAVKYLLFLEAEPEKLTRVESSNDQKYLFEVYEALYPKYSEILNKAINKSKKDVVQAIRNTVLHEAEYLVRRFSVERNTENSKCKNLDEGVEKLTILKNYYSKRVEGRKTPELNDTSKESSRLTRIEYTLDLITKIDSIMADTIIIHGVHRFTPEILLMLRLLQNTKIEVIFLIHYVDQLPQIYETWKEVYSWTDEEFKNVKSFDFRAGSKTGKEIAKVLSGSLSFEPLNSIKTVYNNLSSFAVGEVRPAFQQAQEELSKMRVQYYAVSNADTNEILKNYFPDQFGIKPFLSYPVGQFVLGIYKMWDFDDSHMRLVPEALRECVVSGMFEDVVGKDIAKIYDDLIPYISDLNALEEVLKRLSHLKHERAFIDRNPNLADMKSICYFSRSQSDVDRFMQYLKLLIKVSNKIFAHETDQIDYSDHFKNMMEILSEPLSNLSIAHRTEVQLAQGILASLGGYDTIKGDYADLKEALMFYLHQSAVDDSSNWIVRNFEQLDGAVLLADHTKAREYHFALLSMKNMIRKASEELPWPLTEEIFYDYDGSLKSSMHASAISNRERANFLKYSLFYGVFFFKKRISFSYVLNQNNEKQRAYYLLDLLKLKEPRKAENKDVFFESMGAKQNSKSFNYESLTIDQREIFAICRYRFFLYRVLNEGIIYNNDFQITYYLRNLITQIILDDEYLNRSNMYARVNKYLDRFAAMFPNYDAVVFGDIRKNVQKDVKSHLDYCASRNIQSYSQHEEYKRRKKNFLIAKWDDDMNFDNVSSQMVLDYMVDDDTLLPSDHRPHVKVCENCNFYADCLMKYYEGIMFRENEV